MSPTDTLALATDLAETGMERAQADKIAAAIGKSPDSHAASKSDLKRIEIAPVHAERALIKTAAAADKSEIKADIAASSHEPARRVGDRRVNDPTVIPAALVASLGRRRRDRRRHRDR